MSTCKEGTKAKQNLISLINSIGKMAFVRRASLVALFFLFAASVMFAVKKTEAGFNSCSEACVYLPCFSKGCSCFKRQCYKNHVIAATSKSIDEHHLLCQSHYDCITKGSGNFCAPFLEHDVPYGWCFRAESEGYLLKDFLKKPMKIAI
uniref:Cyclotide n=1 Tax=Clitoria ternatea TaxID=43366 RepID=A0A7G5F3A8_CLITE|nr:cyclotide precursor [Clitoria ternatea]